MGEQHGTSFDDLWGFIIKRAICISVRLDLSGGQAGLRYEEPAEG